MSVSYLNKEDFTTKVANVWNGGEWKYLGDKPAIIDFFATWCGPWAIIDFFATWCGPCKALSPILEEVADKYKDQIYVYKVDVDQQEELAALFNIRSVPSLLFIPMEGKPKMGRGVMPKSDLEYAIKSVLL